MAKVSKKRKAEKSDGLLAEKLASLMAGMAAYAVRSAPLFLIIAGVFFGVVTLWQKGMSSERFVIKPQVAIGEVTGYQSDAVCEFEKLGMLMTGKNLLDPMLLSEIKEEYEKSPWVISVCKMRRVFPDRVDVEFVPRMPVAQVKHRGYYWLVGSDAVLLPVDGRSYPQQQIPIIVGDIDTRPNNGSVWSGGVMGALDVLESIERSSIATDIAISKIQIKAPSFLDRLSRQGKSRPRLEIKTHCGLSIDWGVCGMKLPGELSNAEKIASLKKLLTESSRPLREFSLDVRTATPGYNLK